MLCLENARPSGWVYIDVQNQNIGSYIREAQIFLQANLKLPTGYFLTRNGQYESMQRANQRMFMIVPYPFEHSPPSLYHFPSEG